MAGPGLRSHRSRSDHSRLPAGGTRPDAPGDCVPLSHSDNPKHNRAAEDVGTTVCRSRSARSTGHRTRAAIVAHMASGKDCPRKFLINADTKPAVNGSPRSTTSTRRRSMDPHSQFESQRACHPQAHQGAVLRVCVSRRGRVTRALTGNHRAHAAGVVRELKVRHPFSLAQKIFLSSGQCRLENGRSRWRMAIRLCSSRRSRAVRSQQIKVRSRSAQWLPSADRTAIGIASLRTERRPGVLGLHVVRRPRAQSQRRARRAAPRYERSNRSR